MLEIQNVSKPSTQARSTRKWRWNGLNLKLNEGDFVTVIGGNGAGKSTMLERCGRCVAGGRGQDPHWTAWTSPA